MAQNPWFWSALAVRTSTDPLSMTKTVKAAIAKVNPDVPATGIRTMEEIESESIARPRFRARLVTAFAGISVLLAAVGIFGVLAFSVVQRRREFGIRMALGARTSDVFRLVLGSGLRITAMGMAIGIAASAALVRLLNSFLFGVKPFDTTTFLTGPILLGAIALVACVLPGIRAAHVDPASALRQE